ncbi:MAG: flagellar protein G, partial [Thermoplasmata archaeon]|nr:flagellar protein G [Thermoplasmata archaeon]
QLATDIQIINDPSVVPNDPVLIYIKNVGKVTLNQELVSVMLDGTAVANATVTVTGGTSAYWEPTSVLTVSIDQSLAAGDHTVTVTTENGVSDKMDFRI